MMQLQTVVLFLLKLFFLNPAEQRLLCLHPCSSVNLFTSAGVVPHVVVQVSMLVPGFYLRSMQLENNSIEILVQLNWQI